MSCDAERLDGGVVVADGEDSVLGLLMAERGTYGLGSVTSAERNDTKLKLLLDIFKI